MATGRVIRFDETRGYGFISPDNGREDVFVHANDLLDAKSLYQPGLQVAFEIVDGERGLKAADVRMIKSAANSSAEPHDLATAIRHPVGTTTQSGAGRDESDDGLCDLLSVDELKHELTEALLNGVPSLTGEQIVQVRRQFIALAGTHNWLEA